MMTEEERDSSVENVLLKCPRGLKNEAHKDKIRNRQHTSATFNWKLKSSVFVNRTG